MVRKKRNHYILPGAAFLLILGAVFWHKFVYHPADKVVDAYVVQSAEGLRINFIDYYRISVNAGNTRTPVYLESTHHRFHSLDARTGRALADDDLGDSVYIGRSRYAVWFLNGKTLLQLDPTTGKECRRDTIASDKFHNIDYSIGTDVVKILYHDGRSDVVQRAPSCGQPADLYEPTPVGVDLAFGGNPPRQFLVRAGKTSAEDFLTPEILRARYYGNRNLVNTQDSWNRAQREITTPVTDPSGIVYIRHKKALNQSAEFISAVTRDALTAWSVEVVLRGSFVLPDPDGFTVVTDTSPLFFRQRAVHVNRAGHIDWKYAY